MRLILLVISLLLQLSEIRSQQLSDRRSQLESDLRSQRDIIYNQTKFEYKGKVNSVLIESFKPQFHADSVIGYEHMGPLMGVHQRIYFDENGLITGKDNLTWLCDNDSLVVASVWTYHYSEGRLDSFFQKELDGESVKDGWKFYYLYDGDISYEYASKENQKSRRVVNGAKSDTVEIINMDATISSSMITHYDKFHRKQRVENWNTDGLESTTTYFYKDTLTDKPMESYWMVFSSNEIIRKVFEYNEYQDITSFTWYDSAGKQVNGSRFEYIYDDKGNWVEKKSFTPKGDLLFVFKQTFEYQ